MNENCGCCEGIEQLTPIAILNRPGLNALYYRVGTHASFLETMLARLSNLPLEILLNEFDADGKQKTATIYPLQGLTTRAANDPSITLLDAWATVADVLTFYQERIANEGYLRTATERRSVLELARLVGYTLRPGVAASVFLAYTLEKDHNVIILPGNRAQSVPGPGELPQSFETAEKLEARADWNALKPRLTHPQYIIGSSPDQNKIFHNINTSTIYLQGTATKLKAGDSLLFFDDSETQFAFLKVSSIDPQAAASRTEVALQDTSATTTMDDTLQSIRSLAVRADGPSSLFSKLVTPLSLPPSLQPRNAQRLERSVSQAFATQSDIHPQMLVNFTPLLQSSLYSALASVNTTTIQAQQLTKVRALRARAALFGHNLPVPPDQQVIPIAETSQPATSSVDPKLIALDAEYKDIVAGSWVIVERRDQDPPLFTISKVDDVQTITLGGTPADNLKLFTTLGATTKTFRGNPPPPSDTTTVPITSTISDPVKIKVTVLTLHDQWLSGDVDSLVQTRRQEILGQTIVYAQSEELTLSEEPLDDEISDEILDANGQQKKVGADTIELDRLYDGLKSGQRLIISGERTDVLQTDSSGKPIPGVRVSELVMLGSVTQEVEQIKDSSGKQIPRPGDKTHTFLHLAKRLAYTYKRDTVSISANIVRATHGETRSETLGSGDGSKALQRFTLKQSPLTYLAAATPAGAQSTLQVRVDDILWHEAESLAELHPKDRSYILETDDAGKTSVISGNGIYGARLPTGVENVKAVYRTGIGKPGNVKAKQINLLATKPLGVKSVINPLRASGGADSENRDQARRNVPLAVMALDRLVSVQDYADFARTYAGIGKASSVQLRTVGHQLVNVTIAGADNIPIDTDSDLYQNLVQALFQFGDPHQPLRVDIADVKFIVVSAKVRLLPDYALEFVEPSIRATLLDAFSFDRRELGQPVFESEVLSIIQGIAGVDYVELDILGAVDQDIVLKAFDFITQNPQGDPKKDEEVFLNQLGLKDHKNVEIDLASIDDKAADPKKRILPAQLAFLTPDIPDTLILTELSS